MTYCRCHWNFLKATWWERLLTRWVRYRKLQPIMKLSICIYMCMFEWCGDGKAIRPTVSGAVFMYVCLPILCYFFHIISFRSRGRSASRPSSGAAWCSVCSRSWSRCRPSTWAWPRDSVLTNVMMASCVVSPAYRLYCSELTNALTDILDEEIDSSNSAIVNIDVKRLYLMLNLHNHYWDRSTICKWA